MKNIHLILIGGLYLIILVQWFVPKKEEEPARDYTKEMAIELKGLKEDIQEIKNGLTKQYEKIDTIRTATDAHAHIRDFMERTNGRLPTGHPRR